MRQEFLSSLRCPVCGQALQLEAAQAQSGEIWSGTLQCAGCQRTFPMREGIPLLQPGSGSRQDEHWERLHQQVDYQAVVRLMRPRFELPESVLLDYYAHAALARRQGLQPGSMLELGSGTGSYSLALQRLVAVKNICLLDISLSSLLGARKIFAAFGLKPDLVQGDIRSLPFAGQTFDLTLSGGLIEHFAGEEQSRIMAEHCRVGTAALIQAPLSSPAYWMFRLGYTLYKGRWPFGFERPMTKRKIRKLLAAQNMHIAAWGGHDFAASAELLGRLRWKNFPRLHAWPGLAALTRHDVIVLGAHSSPLVGEDKGEGINSVNCTPSPSSPPTMGRGIS
jgi:ubiquinone/menaquinone biosynthesis C-methylase UbiE/uncharacterized protein YbaR (Trm112 family)